MPIHRKRPAPKPPMTTVTAKTTTSTTTKDDNNWSTNNTKSRAQNDNDNAQHDHREFIEKLIDSTIKLETLGSVTNETDEEKYVQKPVDKISSMCIKINKTDEKIETKQNKDNVSRDNIIKTKIPASLVHDVKSKTTTTTTVTITTQTEQLEQHPNSDGSYKILPILAGNTTNDSFVSEHKRESNESFDQLLESKSHQHQLHVMHERNGKIIYMKTLLKTNNEPPNQKVMCVCFCLVEADGLCGLQLKSTERRT